MKDCKDCVYHEVKEIVNYTTIICAYPVPAYLKIRLAGGNFISGYEAMECQLFKNKTDLAQETKKDKP